jgi:hypothetical protein
MNALSGRERRFRRRGQGEEGEGREKCNSMNVMQEVS